MDNFETTVKKTRRGVKFLDPVLLISMLALLVIGMAMIMSTSTVVGYSNFQDSYYFVKRHAIYMALGFVAFFVGWRISHQLFKKFVIWGYFGSTVLLALTLVPGIGVRAWGASRWLNLGFVQIQPTEISKFFVVVAASAYLENKKNHMGSFKKGILPLLAILGPPVLILAKQPDLGNVICLSSIVMVLLFLSDTKLKHMLTLVGLGITGVIASILKNPYQMERIHAFLDPWDDPLGKSYHIVQSLIAIGSGGFWGHGLGQSKLKFFYLPLQYSDFVYSVLCEEGGFILGALVICLFAIILYKGVKISKTSHSIYSRNLVVGLSLVLVLEAIININVVIGMFPVTGIPLTFISFGGTSLIVSMFSVGVMQNIYDSTKS